MWCRWCCIWHIHGLADGEQPGDAVHRIMHCTAADAPAGGGAITVSGVPFEAVCRSVREATYRQSLMIQQGRITPAIDRLRRQPEPAP